jgi:hydroxyquinol 1,2-dioxygenase
VVQARPRLAREVDLTPEEWMAAIQFLTRSGQTCDEKRQEFILLSDTLGISMLVVQLDQARRSPSARWPTATATVKPTEATVQGPFYWEGAPVLPLGSDIGEGHARRALAYYSGRVTDTHGKPHRRCCLDVWSGDGEGVYDMQMGGDTDAPARALHDRRRRPLPLLVDQAHLLPGAHDGPVGDMLRAMGRHPNRPGHIHMMVYRTATCR